MPISKKRITTAEDRQFDDVRQFPTHYESLGSDI